MSLHNHIELQPLNQSEGPLANLEEATETAVLNQLQIDYCIEQIEKCQPLKQAPLVKVWTCLPYLCCCCCSDRPIENPEEKSEEEIRLEEDPFVVLGFGINAYFSFL